MALGPPIIQNLQSVENAYPLLYISYFFLLHIAFLLLSFNCCTYFTTEPRWAFRQCCPISRETEIVELCLQAMKKKLLLKEHSIQFSFYFHIL